MTFASLSICYFILWRYGCSAYFLYVLSYPSGFLHRSTKPLFYCIPILGNIFVWRHSVHVPYSSHPILWFQAGAQSLRIERMEEMRSQIDRYFPFYQASCHPNPSTSIWLSFSIIFTNIMLFYYILYIVWTQESFCNEWVLKNPPLKYKQ